MTLTDRGVQPAFLRLSYDIGPALRCVLFLWARGGCLATGVFGAECCVDCRSGCSVLAWARSTCRGCACLVRGILLPVCPRGGRLGGCPELWERRVVRIRDPAGVFGGGVYFGLCPSGSVIVSESFQLGSVAALARSSSRKRAVHGLVNVGLRSYPMAFCPVIPRRDDADLIRAAGKVSTIDHVRVSRCW